MAERADYLTHEERELLARRSEFESADAIQGVAQLAVRLSGDLAIDIDRIRQADPELAKKLGRKTAQILALLDSLPPAPTVETTEAIQDTVEVSVEPEPIAAPNSIEPVIVEAQESLNSTPEQILPELEISKIGLRWLEKSFGADWKTAVRVTPTDTIESVSARIVAMAPPSTPTMHEKAVARIAGRLKGLSATETVALSTDDTPAGAQVYLSVMSKKLSSLTPPMSLRSAPINTNTIVTPTYDFENETVDIDVQTEVVANIDEVERLEQEPKHVRLSVLISEKLEFTESQQLALQSFLDPASSGTLSEQKREVVELVREEIRDKIDIEGFDLTDAERRWVRSSFGVYTAFNQPKDVKPLTLHEMMNNGRNPSQKNEIPGFVYAGLDKLFTDAVHVERVEKIADILPGSPSLDDFVRAVVEPDTLTKEAYQQYRAEVEKELVDSGDFSVKQVAALMKRSRYGRNGEHQQVNGMLKSALTKLMKKAMQDGGVNSGNTVIDSSFKKFILPNFMTSHLDAVKANLPEEMQHDPEIIERVILAGMYSLYASQEQQVA